MTVYVHPSDYPTTAAAAAATPVEKMPLWQSFAENLTENDDFNAPARIALRAAAAEETPEEIATHLKEMYDQDNFGGMSELLDELERDPEGLIFEALKVLSGEIVDQIVNVHIQEPNDPIGDLLVKAIETNKHGAIHAICASIPFVPRHAQAWYPSGILMENCLDLVIDDIEKEAIARQILTIFVDTARQSKTINAAFELFSDDPPIAGSSGGIFVKKCEFLLYNQTKSARKT